jgi:hypothetical protein
MPFKYIVQCWITPRSGFDLAKKGRIAQLFRSVMRDTFSDDKKVETAINNFEKTHEGLVLESLTVETDTEIIDPDSEILPEIRKKYPEAVIFSCKMVSELAAVDKA